jgi:hypothetical protein
LRDGSVAHVGDESPFVREDDRARSLPHPDVLDQRPVRLWGRRLRLRASGDRSD